MFLSPGGLGSSEWRSAALSSGRCSRANPAKVCVCVCVCLITTGAAALYCLYQPQEGGGATAATCPLGRCGGTQGASFRADRDTSASAEQRSAKEKKNSQSPWMGCQPTESDLGGKRSRWQQSGKTSGDTGEVQVTLVECCNGVIS